MKRTEELVSRHIQFYKDDWELLDSMFGLRSRSQMGTSKAIRQIIRMKCQALRAKRAEVISRHQIESVRTTDEEVKL